VTRFDPAAIAAEAEWLRDNPEFIERPATLQEFLGPDYLNIADGVRESIKESLADIMGDEINSRKPTKFAKAMLTGGIGIGKTTIASIVLPYLCHWVLCLKDPQGFFDLLPGSRIAFMQMSTSEGQAREVLFGDIVARIKHSPWFRDGHPMDPTYKNQIRFEKDVWILPGDSQETTFEGYNILGGILDEADSHKVTVNRDYARAGYETIHARITSRFGDRGFILIIGQMKKSDGFAAQMYEEYRKDDDAYARRMTIWESLGWDKFMTEDGERDSFWYDAKKKSEVPKAAALLDPERFIEVPNLYRKDFDINPEKALRDLAGIPPTVGDPFISLTHKVEEARDRWKASNEGYTTPVLPDGTFEDWFKATDSLRRVVHLDLAYSANGDALGIAMGHVREIVEIDGEKKPYIVFDLLYRMKALPGSEIMLSDVRRFVYHLRDELKFKIKRVTMDGFQSQDTFQQLRKRRFETDHVSVDKQMLPYYDLRDALYEDRIEFPEYLVYMNRGDTTRVEIAYKELAELSDNGKKVDHPPMGSKDVADAMAGCVYTLMGDRSFRRSVTSLDQYRQRREATGTDGGSPWGTPNAGPYHPALGSLAGMSAPAPPTTIGNPLDGPRWDGPVRTK
jgi:hypothetical protein